MVDGVIKRRRCYGYRMNLCTRRWHIFAAINLYI